MDSTSKICFAALLGLICSLLVGAQGQGSKELPPLPPGVELLNPKDLGLSEADLDKFLGKVKLLPSNGVGGDKTQILTVGFDDNEKINLQDFEQLSSAGLQGPDKAVAEMAFKGFQQQYGPGSPKSNELTTASSLGEGQGQPTSSPGQGQQLTEHQHAVNSILKQQQEQQVLFQTVQLQQQQEQQQIINSVNEQHQQNQQFQQFQQQQDQQLQQQIQQQEQQIQQQIQIQQQQQQQQEAPQQFQQPQPQQQAQAQQSHESQVQQQIQQQQQQQQEILQQQQQIQIQQQQQILSDVQQQGPIHFQQQQGPATTQQATAVVHKQQQHEEQQYEPTQFVKEHEQQFIHPNPTQQPMVIQYIQQLPPQEAYVQQQQQQPLYYQQQQQQPEQYYQSQEEQQLSPSPQPHIQMQYIQPSPSPQPHIQMQYIQPSPSPQPQFQMQYIQTEQLAPTPTRSPYVQVQYQQHAAGPPQQFIVQAPQPSPVYQNYPPPPQEVPAQISPMVHFKAGEQEHVVRVQPGHAAVQFMPDQHEPQHYKYMPAMPPNQIENEPEYETKEFVTYHNSVPDKSHGHMRFPEQRYKPKAQVQHQQYFGKQEEPEQEYDPPTFRQPIYSQNAIDHAPAHKNRHNYKENFGQSYFSQQRDQGQDHGDDLNKYQTKFRFPIQAQAQTQTERTPTSTKFDYGGHREREYSPVFPTPRPTGNPYFEVTPSTPIIRISDPENAIPKGSRGNRTPTVIRRDNNDNDRSYSNIVSQIAHKPSSSSIRTTPMSPTHYDKNKTRRNFNYSHARDLMSSGSDDRKSITVNDLMLKDMIDTILRSRF